MIASVFLKSVCPARISAVAVAILLAACACFGPVGAARAADSISAAVNANQPKMVKIYGAGGLRGLEPYQSGILISDSGHILTVWSYVLDTDYITATLDDGRKFEAKLAGADPRAEIAVLKIDATELPHFDLAASVPGENGTRVLALSNLFGVATGDEQSSVQHGTISVKTRLDARRGTFETPYHGAVYVLDAMTNNPGAAGGALLNQHGELLGLLGKELRNAQNNLWLNYSLPIDEIRAPIEAIVAGQARVAEEKQPAKPDEAIEMAALGLVLVPDVLERTPPYVDVVRAGSLAEKAGIRSDDLIVFVGENLVHSCKGFVEELARIERGTPLRLMLLRKQELVEVVLNQADEDEPDGQAEPGESPKSGAESGQQNDTE